MNKVFLLSRGSYSDYSVGYVCQTREVAESLRARLNIGTDEYEWDIEERVLVSDATEVEAVVLYWVVIDDAGNETRRFSSVVRRPEDTGEDAVAENDGKSHHYRGVRGEMFEGRSIRGYDVALKIARDKLAEVKAKEALL